jgi:PAS domain S-box-containing protein
MKKNQFSNKFETQNTDYLIKDFRYKALFEQTSDAVFMISLNLEFLEANHQALEMLGYKSFELEGLPFYKVISLKENGAGIHDYSADPNAPHQIYERIFVRKDGTTLPVEVSTSIVYDYEGKPSHIQSFVRDITERKKIEQVLIDSEKRNRVVVDAFPDLVFRINDKGILIDFSANEEHPLYRPREELFGTHISDIFPEKSSELMMEKVFDTIKFNKENIFEHKFPEDSRLYEIRLYLIGEKEILGVVRDVSERARLEQMKSDFINRASHELRTPLTSAIIMADLIQEGGTEEELKEYWEILLSELNRQKILIERFLVAGRLESNMLIMEKTSVDLLPIIKESIASVSPIARQKRIVFTEDIPENLPNVIGEVSGLQQVFINLLNNAVKFSPEGNTVELKAFVKASDVCVTIRDHGLGIPKEAIPNLFERFFRARNVTLAEIPGSGVGLYIVRSILEELGGTISVKSDEGEGSTFEIWLSKA